jgi:glycosyltransferase involved in cell wall biosynthesis
MLHGDGLGTDVARSSPLFSVVWYGRNRVQSARDCIASIQAQTCGDLEFVVDDSGSTDGTLEAFRAAAAKDPRIRLSPGTALSSGEGLLAALRRCRGDYIAICPHEGRFLPDAL